MKGSANGLRFIYLITENIKLMFVGQNKTKNIHCQVYTKTRFISFKSCPCHNEKNKLKMTIKFLKTLLTANTLSR